MLRPFQVFDIEDEIASSEIGYELHNETTSPRKARRNSNSTVTVRPHRSSLIGTGHSSSSPSEIPQHPRKRALSHRLSGVPEDLTQSPLAHAFTPLNIEENAVEESPLSSSPQQMNPPNVSYGPAMRRRLSSMVYRGSTMQQPFPGADTPRRVSASSGPPSTGDVTPPPEPRPKSVTQLVTESEMMGGEGAVERRLARIEQMQTKLEHMMTELLRLKR